MAIFGVTWWYELVNYFENIWINLSTYPFIIQVSIIFIFINTAFAIFVLGSTILLRRNIKKRETIVKDLRGDLVKFFKSILDKDEPIELADINDAFVERFGSLSKKKYISITAALESIVKEDRNYVQTVNYYRLVAALQIINYFEKRLDFSSTRDKLRVFQTMSNLELTVSDSKILPFTYSKDNILKNESRISYIGVSKNEPFKFFEQAAGNQLNQWSQISLLKQFEIHHKDNLPDFGRWIKYTDEVSQKQFCIRMVAHFNQRESIDILIEALQSSESLVRKEAIIALGKMRVKEAEPIFIDMYYYEPNEIQNSIIESILWIRSGEASEFLKEIFDKSSNLDTKRMIAEVMYYYNDDTRKYFEQRRLSAKGFERTIFEHSQNSLIGTNIKRIAFEMDPNQKMETENSRKLVMEDLKKKVSGKKSKKQV